MEVVKTYSAGSVASVFLGRTSLGNEVEFVESIQPPFDRDLKEVVIVSSLVGCPVGCAFCDAGGHYRRKLTAEEILEQIDYVVLNRYGCFQVPAKKFKIQFARIGEPSLNDGVLKVLKQIEHRYEAPGLILSVSSIGPRHRTDFFEKLLDIKNERYRGRLSLQFSIHSTDATQRRQWVPMDTLSFSEMNAYGERFVGRQDRKIALNFALEKASLVDASILGDFFDPHRFLIKITPLNPTYSAMARKMTSGVDTATENLPYHPGLVDELKRLGFEVLVAVGELVENEIGSNCGQLVRRHLYANRPLQDGYSRIH